MSSAKEVNIPAGTSYMDYRQMLDELFAQNKTTGDNHSEAMLHYTKLNIILFVISINSLSEQHFKYYFPNFTKRNHGMLGLGSIASG